MFSTKTLTAITSPLDKPIVAIQGNRAEATGTEMIDSIDPHIRQLECLVCNPSFSAETIGNLTHLWLDDITHGTTFPRSLEHLFVWGYSGREPLPRVRNIYIELGYESNIQQGQRVKHRIILAPSRPSGKPRKYGYKVRKQQSIEAFGSMHRYYERVPIKQTGLNVALQRNIQINYRREELLSPITGIVRTNLEELWRIDRAATNTEARRRSIGKYLYETDTHGLFLFHLEQIEDEIIKYARKGKLGGFCVSIYTPKGYAVGEALARERLPYCKFSEHMGQVLIRVRKPKQAEA